MPKWTADDIPDQTNKVVVITGANSGLGYETSKALAAKGATVVMACRNMEKGERALQSIRQQTPVANLELMQLDLSDLESVASFAEQFNETHTRLDILFNNAGLMAIPFRKTKQGFEMTIGVNHFGHFALTGLLMPVLMITPESRVVTTSSLFHKRGKIFFDDINYETRKYKKWEAYAQSKLANLLFALELQNRFSTAGKKTISVAAHPGYARTHLQEKGAEMQGRKIARFFARIGNALFAQSAERGALPQLYAGTAHEVQGGDYYGPSGFFETRGYPKKVKPSKRAQDASTMQKLWELSEELTGIKYKF